MATITDIRNEIEGKSFVDSIAHYQVDKRTNYDDFKIWEVLVLLNGSTNDQKTIARIKIIERIVDGISVATYVQGQHIDKYDPDNIKNTYRDAVLAKIIQVMGAVSNIVGYSNLEFLNGSDGATVDVYWKETDNVEIKKYFLDENLNPTEMII